MSDSTIAIVGLIICALYVVRSVYREWRRINEYLRAEERDSFERTQCLLEREALPKAPNWGAAPAEWRVVS